MGLEAEPKHRLSLLDQVVGVGRRLILVAAVTLGAVAIVGAAITYHLAESSDSDWDPIPWLIMAVLALTGPMCRDLLKSSVDQRAAARARDGYCPHCGFDMRGIAGECRCCHRVVEELCGGMTAATRKGDRELLVAVLGSVGVLLFFLILMLIDLFSSRSCWTLLGLALASVMVVDGLIGSALRTRRWEQRLREERCPRCNFDCRATPGRCPECGFGRPYDEDEQPAP